MPAASPARVANQVLRASDEHVCFCRIEAYLFLIAVGLFQRQYLQRKDISTFRA
jgi:hypothetical protein